MALTGKAWRWTALGLAGWLAATGTHAAATSGTTPNKAGIYVCTDAQGRKITSDRPIPECFDREQRLLNADGSKRGVVPRLMSPSERAAAEDDQRRKQLEAATRLDAVRRDRNLLARYPNEAAHDKARAAALDDIRNAVENSKKRLAELDRERKPLLDEAEFYAAKKNLPAQLKRQLDDNEVSAEAQKTLIQNQEVELQRVNALYDTELAKLKRLWAGGPPGSIDAAASASASRAPK